MRISDWSSDVCSSDLSDRSLAAISAIDRRPRLIISRYVMREVTAPFVAVVAVVSIVFLAYTLSLFLASAGDGVLSAGQVVTLSLLKTVIALEVLLPIALYVAVVLGMGVRKSTRLNSSH